MTVSPFLIRGRELGRGPAFVIAEAGVNHNGDLDLARRLVDAAAAAGADAVKFQTFRTEALVNKSAPKAEYQRETTGSDESQAAMLKRLELGPAEHAELVRHAARHGIVFFSAPFDEASADLLDSLGVLLFKVPSGEITNAPLLQHIARKGKPIVLSTGMSTLDEVATAVAAVRDAGDPPIVLLHCLSAYPAPTDEINLRAMDTLRERFGCPVGFSDHTLGLSVPIGAVGRGAAVIEKHVTLDKTLPGPDHRASLEPDEFRALVTAIRDVETALGDGDKRPMPSEEDTRRVARKSLVAARALRTGERLAADAIAIKRPGTGLSPADREKILGRRVRRDIAEDELLDWKDLEP